MQEVRHSSALTADDIPILRLPNRLRIRTVSHIASISNAIVHLNSDAPRTRQTLRKFREIMGSIRIIKAKMVLGGAANGPRGRQPRIAIDPRIRWRVFWKITQSKQCYNSDRMLQISEGQVGFSMKFQRKRSSKSKILDAPAVKAFWRSSTNVLRLTNGFFALCCQKRKQVSTFGRHTCPVGD